MIEKFSLSKEQISALSEEDIEQIRNLEITECFALPERWIELATDLRFATYLDELNEFLARPIIEDSFGNRNKARQEWLERVRKVLPKLGSWCDKNKLKLNSLAIIKFTVFCLSKFLDDSSVRNELNPDQRHVWNYLKKVAFKIKDVERYEKFNGVAKLPLVREVDLVVRLFLTAFSKS